MIAATYSAVRASVCIATGIAFVRGWLDATSQTLCWSRDVLPRLRRGQLGLPHGERGVPARDARDLDLALLCAGHRRSAASSAPPLFGALIETRQPRRRSSPRYALAARAHVRRRRWRRLELGVDAERRPLEEVCAAARDAALAA